MKKIFAKLVLTLISTVSVSNVYATDYYIQGLSIAFIRAVGNYQAGTTFDNTIELWFKTPVNCPAESNCPVTYRVYIDSKNPHLVAAAYLAFASDYMVSVNVDNTLPIRYGACEVSFLDITK